MCVLVYNCLHQSAPIYLSELRIPAAATANRSQLYTAELELIVERHGLRLHM